MEPPWWLNWLADLASVTGLSFVVIYPGVTSAFGWILGYLPPTPPVPRVHLQTNPIRPGNPPRVSLFHEAYGDAYRGVVGAHKPIGEQFWVIAFLIGGIVISCVLYYLSQDPQADLPIFPVLQSVWFFLMAVLGLITVLLIIRLHLRIRYENALLAQEHGY